MTVVHIGFHLVQSLIGAGSLYALLSDALQIAVICMFLVFALELFDGVVKAVDKIVQAKIGL
ncbi:MAG: hypothetical protein ACXQTM_08175 [Methanosarcinales archaeon]